MRQEDKLWDGYRLIQDDQFFKLGQDSILLSDFANPSPRARVCDLGCGNGALGILLCAQQEKIHVTGLEIQPEVAALAQENVELNHLSSRMDVVCGDVRNVKTLFSVGSFDYLVCNPPYFSSDSGYHAAGQNRNRARQETDGTLKEFIRAAAYLVKYGGRAAFVHRPERLCDCISLFRNWDMEPKRIRFVHQTASSVPSAVLMEVRRGSVSGVQILPPLLICKENGEKSEDYNRIYHKNHE
jgi:tRNA1(Val) A37 N6-methylase TrmN6